MLYKPQRKSDSSEK